MGPIARIAWQPIKSRWQEHTESGLSALMIGTNPDYNLDRAQKVRFSLPIAAWVRARPIERRHQRFLPRPQNWRIWELVARIPQRRVS